MNDEDAKKPPARGVSRKRRRPSEFLNKDSGDLCSHVEHLIAVGLKEKRETERYQFFQSTEEGPLSRRENPRHCTNNMDKSDTSTQIKGQKATSLVEAFVEDIRLYDEPVNVKYEGMERHPWPRKTTFAATNKGRKTPNLEQNWELEYGDSIHPLAFSAARLSQGTPTTHEVKDRMINGTHLNVATTDASLPEEDTPRALLLRCWERAVHAAAQTRSVNVKSAPDRSQPSGEEHDIFSSQFFGGTILGLGDSDNTTTEPIIRPSTAVKLSTFTATQQKLAKNTAAMKQKCNSLGLGLTRSQLPEDVSKLTCPSCYRAFDQLSTLQKHYFGTRDNQGCCWRRIIRREPEIVAQVLEKHAETQVDEFLGLIMDQAKGKVLERSDSKSQVFSWYDILQFTEKAVHSSPNLQEQGSSSDPSPKDGSHPIFETLQRSPDSTPLVLNSTIVQNARKRLIDRYTNASR